MCGGTVSGPTTNPAFKITGHNLENPDHPSATVSSVPSRPTFTIDGINWKEATCGNGTVADPYLFDGYPIPEQVRGMVEGEYAAFGKDERSMGKPYRLHGKEWFAVFPKVK